MLGVLAIVTAGITSALALVVGVGLTEQGQSGRPVMSVFAAILMLSTLTTAIVVVRTVLGDASPLLAIAAVPPLTMLALLIVDPAALWGNFPPARTRQVTDRILVVVVFALPGALAAVAG